MKQNATLEVHCGGVAVVETEYYKGDIPQASSCGLFRISEAGKKVAVATSSVPLAYVYCLVIPLTLNDAGFWRCSFRRNEVCLIKLSFK